MRAEVPGTRVSLAIGMLAIGAVSTPVSAQCSVAANSGENVYVKDPIGGCRGIAMSGGTLVSKPRVRRDMTTHVIVFRHFVDGAVPITTNGTISNERNGTAGGIGYKEFDLTLSANAPLGDMIITLNSIVNDYTLRLAVDRRGEVTGVSQTPNPARWGDPVQVTMTGRDIGNASLQVRDHTVSGVTGTTTTLAYTAKASITTARTSADVTVWDKANAVNLANYVRVGQPVPGQVLYSTAAAAPTCTSMPSIAAPLLTSPAGGAVMSFASPTDPLKATVSMSWPQSGDPQRKYILHVENSMISATTPTTTVTKSGSTATVAPLGSTDETVGPFSASSAAASVTRQLTRNRVYKWKVRAVNCGQSAPWSAVGTFTVK